MSNQYKEKLNTINQNILQGKTEIAEALRWCGISDVVPSNVNPDSYETFASYASKIRRLKSANSMILEFTIPTEENLSNYKRTVVLPMYGLNLNQIAQDIINAQKAENGSISVQNEDNQNNDEKTSINDYIISDFYGNEISDGNHTITLEDVNKYLLESEAMEIISLANELGVELSNEPSVQADDPDAQYAFTVNWGDGTSATYTDSSSIDAIYHTYASGGVYDVEINGNFRRIYTSGDDQANLVIDGNYFQDVDGVNVVSNYNYAMIKYLNAVISWGNTLLTNCNSAFRRCEKLASIPMYDTTNSFEDVTDFSYMFRRCYALAEIPFNSNTNRGLFSNCTKATTFAYAFYGCSGLTGGIPPKFIDGCINVTSVAGIFAECPNMSGSIPVGMFKGMTKLTIVSEAFSNCGLTGKLSDDLFIDSPNITNIYRLFYNSPNITGYITKNFIGGLTNLVELRQAFYNCRGIQGLAGKLLIDVDGNPLMEYTINEDKTQVTPRVGNAIQVLSNQFVANGVTYTLGSEYVTDTENNQYTIRNNTFSIPDPTGWTDDSNCAFYGWTANNINGRMAFYGCTGIKDIPEGLFDNLTGTGHWFELMFAGCTSIKTISNTVLKSLNVNNARGMFGGCTSITSNLPDAPDLGDWNTLAGIEKWYGVFAGCSSMGNYASIPLELGGDGDRKFSEGSVGSIVLADKTLVDPKNYTYSDSNRPIAVVYANVKINTALDANQIGNGAGNVDESGTAKIYACGLNDITKAFVSSQNLAEDNPKITNTTNYNVAYNRTRYAGEIYTQAWRDLINENSYESSRYPAIEWVDNYVTDGTSAGDWFLGDGADLWDMFVERYLIDKACSKIIQGGGTNSNTNATFSSSNCYPFRLGTWYWGSGENSSTGAWRCTSGSANVHAYNKWYSYYVRACLSI